MAITPKMLVDKQIIDFVGKRLTKMNDVNSKSTWQIQADKVRKKMLNLFFKGHPQGLLTDPFRIEWRGKIDLGKEYIIRKLRYEGYPGLWVSALLYQPKKLRGKVPCILNANGHHRGGNSMPYKQARCLNLAKRGFLALSYEYLGMGELHSLSDHQALRYLDICGIAGVGVFYLTCKRALDVLLNHPNADKKKVLMTGLSGGGWQTAILSSLDKRVTHIVPVAGHSPVWQRKDFPCDIGDSEQVPSDLTTIADYDTLSAMFAPRPSLFIYNRNDNCCFQPQRTRVSIYFPARKIYRLLGAEDKVEFYVNKNPGTHNYESDNRIQLYKFIKKHMNIDIPVQDFDCEDEILTEKRLQVGLPADNATFLTLARKELIKIRKLRDGSSGKKFNINAQRRKLKTILCSPDYEVINEKKLKSPKKKRIIVENWQLNLSKEWLVPVTIIKPENPKGLCLYLRHKGNLRSDEFNYELKNFNDNNIRIYFDLLGQGKLYCTGQYHMIISSTGERSLGIQTSQLIALAEWCRKKYPDLPVTLHARNEMPILIALLTSALRSDLFTVLDATPLPRSLDYIIERPIYYVDRNAPAFCFGLLKEFDSPDLIKMTDRIKIIDNSRGPIKGELE